MYAGAETLMLLDEHGEEITASTTGLLDAEGNPITGAELLQGDQ